MTTNSKTTDMGSPPLIYRARTLNFSPSYFVCRVGTFLLNLRLMDARAEDR
jgi:hypothetical protein